MSFHALAQVIGALEDVDEKPMSPDTQVVYQPITRAWLHGWVVDK